jgi:hypothetical protein
MGSCILDIRLASGHFHAEATTCAHNGRSRTREVERSPYRYITERNIQQTVPNGIVISVRTVQPAERVLIPDLAQHLHQCPHARLGLQCGAPLRKELKRFYKNCATSHERHG